MASRLLHTFVPHVEGFLICSRCNVETENEPKKIKAAQLYVECAEDADEPTPRLCLVEFTTGKVCKRLKGHGGFHHASPTSQPDVEGGPKLSPKQAKRAAAFEALFERVPRGEDESGDDPDYGFDAPPDVEEAQPFPGPLLRIAALEAELADTRDANALVIGSLKAELAHRIGLLGEELARVKKERDEAQRYLRIATKAGEKARLRYEQAESALAAMTKERDEAQEDKAEYKRRWQAWMDEAARVKKERDEARLETQGWRDLCNERRRDEVGGAQIRAEQAELALKVAQERVRELEIALRRIECSCRDGMHDFGDANCSRSVADEVLLRAALQPEKGE